MSRLSPTLYRNIFTNDLRKVVDLFHQFRFRREYSAFFSIFAVICTPPGLAAFHGRYDLLVSAFKNSLETPGHKVTLLADKKKPQAAFLKELYFEFI